MCHSPHCCSLSDDHQRHHHINATIMPNSRVRHATPEQIYNRVKKRLTELTTLVFPRVPVCTQNALRVQVRATQVELPRFSLCSLYFVCLSLCVVSVGTLCGDRGTNVDCQPATTDANSVAVYLPARIINGVCCVILKSSGYRSLQSAGRFTVWLLP